jgi:hypothetical protein
MVVRVWRLRRGAGQTPGRRGAATHEASRGGRRIGLRIAPNKPQTFAENNTEVAKDQDQTLSVMSGSASRVHAGLCALFESQSLSISFE